jgi:hypothetical protein
MKNTDKLLIGIVAGVTILIGLAFVVALTRPKPAYQADDTPEGAAHNYLLALRQGDYKRAYAYLSPDMKHYPRTLDAFISDVQDNSYLFSLDDDSVTLEVVSSRVGTDFATVDVRETTFYQGDLFSSGDSTSTFSMKLRRSAQGAWKIIDSDSYWAYCWGNTNSYASCD